MAVLRYLLPAFALAGTVLGNGCAAETNTIQNEGDAEALSNCETLDGNLVIAEQTVESIRLDGIQSIKGDFIVEGATNLTGIEAPQLSAIEGDFVLDGLTRLATLDMPALQSVGSINWRALPVLKELKFTREVTKAESVIITNTNLNSLQGIDLETVDRFDVNNNPFLTQIELQLRSISTALNIQANSRNLEVAFPNLQWAYNMTFRNCSSVELPSLGSVNGSLGFINNFFQSFAAPNLTELGRDGFLVFVSNQELTNISFPKLETIGGGLLIANNTQLEAIDGLPELTTVEGAIDLSGNFSKAEIPKLDDVRGGFNLQTSATFDCGPYENLKQDGKIRGRFICTGDQERPGTAQSTPTSTSSGSRSTQSGSADMQKASMGAVFGFSAFAALLLGL